MIRPAPPVVLLDAFGTLVGLDPPVPRLTALLRAAGHEHSEEHVAAALEGEMRFYRVNHDLGRDAASLAALYRRCAEVLAEGLGPDVPDLDTLTECLLASLRFVLLPDALEALDALEAAGARLGMVSNWDYTLPRELDAMGVLHRFEVVAVSADLQVAKPEPAIFHWALERMGVRPEDAVHCGDHPEKDCLGAVAAGVRPVLVDREDRFPAARCTRIARLPDLAALVAGPVSAPGG